MAQTRFSDFTAYTVAELLVLASKSFIYLVGHNEFTNENIKIPFTDFITSVTGNYQTIEATLDEDSTYQNDLLIGVEESNIWAFYAGQEIGTANIMSSFNTVTGIITFNTLYTPITGDIRILYKSIS